MVMRKLIGNAIRSKMVCRSRDGWEEGEWEHS